jgi:DoxX-like family
MSNSGTPVHLVSVQTNSGLAVPDLTMTSNRRSLIPQHSTYWFATGIVALSFLFGGLACLAGAEQQVQGMTDLGYPLYFVTMLAAWKCLGALAIVAPRLPLLKEWAYAGIAFDLIAGSVSHAALTHASGKVIAPLVFLGLTAVSWALRPEGRRLTNVAARTMASDTQMLRAR